MPGWRRPPWLPTRFLARVADVASFDLLDFIEATGRDCSLSTTSVDRRGPPSMPAHRAGYQWPEKLGPRLVEKDGSQQRNTKLKKTGQEKSPGISKPRLRRGSNQVTCRRVTVPIQSRKTPFRGQARFLLTMPQATGHRHVARNEHSKNDAGKFSCKACHWDGNTSLVQFS